MGDIPLMTVNKLLDELKLAGNALSIILTNDEAPPDRPEGGFCTLSLLKRALNGETLCFGGHKLSCPGAKRGMGFCDRLPDIKGGFGNFISNGAGEGFPEGERIKKSPEIAESMIDMQPQDVLNGCGHIIVKPYETGDAASLISFYANCDQLSGLIQLFSYRTGEYDNVIAPLCSGCASIFRIPLGELKREKPRAVIGNVDSFSRVHFDNDRFFFTVSAKAFGEMLEDAHTCFFATSNWKSIKERL
ncbi:MAG: DUF169 domain-containing protein [Oscillospiraceae bacterium]|nr:DUF169 domain-containing protein [Oscillospiraceae bacterium]